jgi:hypothetical protein
MFLRFAVQDLIQHPCINDAVHRYLVLAKSNRFEVHGNSFPLANRLQD